MHAMENLISHDSGIIITFVIAKFPVFGINF